MSFLRARRSVGGNVELRIQVLTTRKTDQIEKKYSPTLKDLRDNKKHVKRLSDLFEQKPWCFNNGVNWWIDEKSAKSESCKEQKFVFKKETKSRSEDPEVIDDVIRMSEIYNMEMRYISELNMFINKTLSATEDAGFIAMKLRENKFCLLGDLKTILQFHKIVILPQLTGTVTKGKCMKFVNFINQLLEDGHFYCYISHKMLEKSMKKLHKRWFFSAPHTTGEMNPYKILESFHDWVTNICNELIKHPTKHSDDLAVCMEVQEKLMDLIDLIVEAELVTRISQVSDVSVEMQFKVFDIIRKNKEIVLPKLLLVPRKSIKFGYRYPLDIMEMGKFMKSYETSMTSQTLGYKNLSRFFVFERCVIYTTVIDGGKAFSYNNHFWVKNIKFSHTSELAELRNGNRSVLIDNTEMMLLLMKQNLKHRDDENCAEIDMSEHDLMKLIDSGEDSKKWRRYSHVFHH